MIEVLSGPAASSLFLSGVVDPDTMVGSGILKASNGEPDIADRLNPDFSSSWVPNPDPNGSITLLFIINSLVYS